MFAKHTIAWFDDKMIGREELLKELLKASIVLEDMESENEKVKVKIKNIADIPFILSDEDGNLFLIPALAETSFNLPEKEGSFKVVNLITGMNENLGFDLDEFLTF